VEITLYHTPRCSKSRAALKLLEERGVRVRIVPYLERPPSPAELDELLAKLGMEPAELFRTKEPLFRELGLRERLARASRRELLRTLSEHPKLIERPIAVRGSRAVVGRPPERVLELL